jgi:hypothetical protein
VNDFASRWCGSGLRGLVILVAATGWTRVAAQAAFNPSAQLWPSGRDVARPSVAVFGSAVACTLVTCDPAPSFGLDVGLLGPLRVAAAGPRSSPQVGLSYAWRHIDIATRIGQGATIVRPLKGGPANLTQDIRIRGDTAGGIHAETTYVSDATTYVSDATRWSSAEARLTWREARWWATALVGRMAIAQKGSGLWGGLQLGAEIGRGASLLIGASTSPRLLSATQIGGARNRLSVGFGFNAGVFSRTPSARSPSPSDASPAFVVSSAGAGHIRIAIRVAAADSVEFASDCTQWGPVQMTRDGDRWVVDVAALAGLHRANIRVNGGRWMSPPGLASMDDEFAGEVGIFVVQ